MVGDIVPLAPHVRNYLWGSKSLIPKFMGWHDSSEPIAELWYGAHSSGSSYVISEDQALTEVIATNSREVLGDDILKVFGPRLPFMLKIIAIDQPLSVQVHPNQVQAQKGHIHKPELYSDEFAKPEQLIALSNMRVLYGFRPLPQVIALFEDLDCPEIVFSLKSSSVSATFLKLLRREFDAEYFNIADSTSFEESKLVQSLALRYPTDRAAAAPYFLNLVELTHGESIIIHPGEVHAYLSGLGIEVLGNSDNVLRAGLTQKVKDLDEFERIVSPSSTEVLTASATLDGIHWWKSQYEEFKVGLYTHNCSSVTIQGPAIVLTAKGQLRANSTLGSFIFTQGQVFFIKGASQVTLEGEAEAYVCTANIN